MLRLPIFCRAPAPAPAASPLPLPALKRRLISHHNHHDLHGCTRTRTRFIQAKASTSDPTPAAAAAAAESNAGRRQVLIMAMVMAVAMAEAEAEAEEEEEYARETKEVIAQVRDTVEMSVAADKAKVSEMANALRESSNNWVAKYRREKKVAGRPSFSNMYSVLNAISGHYISFGASTPIPSKRKARILEELDLAEKALSRGR